MTDNAKTIEPILKQDESAIIDAKDLPDKAGIGTDEVTTEDSITAEDTNIDSAVDQIAEIVKPNGLPFPDVDPIIFEVGPIVLRWYSLAYLFGIVLGWMYIQYVNKKYNNSYISDKKMESIPVWMVISIILGGRIGYVWHVYFFKSKPT